MADAQASFSYSYSSIWHFYLVAEQQKMRVRTLTNCAVLPSLIQRLNVLPIGSGGWTTNSSAPELFQAIALASFSEPPSKYTAKIVLVLAKKV